MSNPTGDSLEFKSPASTPRVVRSWFVDPTQVYFMEGDGFEDGLRRLVVSQTVSEADAMKILETMEAHETEAERIRTQIDTMNALMEKYRADVLAAVSGGVRNE